MGEWNAPWSNQLKSDANVERQLKQLQDIFDAGFIIEEEYLFRKQDIYERAGIPFSSPSNDVPTITRPISPTFVEQTLEEPPYIQPNYQPEPLFQQDNFEPPFVQPSFPYEPEPTYQLQEPIYRPQEPQYVPDEPHYVQQPNEQSPYSIELYGSSYNSQLDPHEAPLAIRAPDQSSQTYAVKLRPTKAGDLKETRGTNENALGLTMAVEFDVQRIKRIEPTRYSRDKSIQIVDTFIMEGGKQVLICTCFRTDN